MPHYISLLRYTTQGVAKIKESPSRLDAARKLAASMGGKIQSWHLTMGKYDAVIITEFPDDEAAARNLSTRTVSARRRFRRSRCRRSRITFILPSTVSNQVRTTIPANYFRFSRLELDHSLLVERGRSKLRSHQ